MGQVGVVVGLVSVAKRWPIARTWLALMGVLAVEILLLVVMFVR